MGNLSNLYISRSFQSLIHLGSDSNATSTLTLLQDGLGNSIGVGVNTSGDVFLSGSLTASLQEGYVYVGNASGKTSAFATASLVTNINTGSLVSTASFNAYTQSNNQRVSSLENNSASVNTSITNLNTTSASLLIETQNLELFSASALVSISNLNQSSASQQVSINALNAATASYVTETESGSFLLTASFDNGTRNLTFTKGNNTQFAVNIPDASGSILPSGVISGSAQITSLGFVSSSVTASSLVTASVNVNVLTFTKGDGSQFNLTVSASGSAPAGTISGSAQITAFGFVSSSVTASSLITASFDNGTRNLTFTKGDNTTFAVNIPDVSGSAGDFVTTASFNSYTSSNDQRVSSLETSTASLFTSASLAIVTASVNNDDITFTKGDGSQFTIQVATGSFALSASFAETASISRNLEVIARNGNASTLGAGTVVHITGASGDNPIFNTASFDTELLSANTLGILRYSSVSGADVQVIVNGIVTGVNTDPALGYAAGDVLYLSSSGQFTKVQPQAPNQIVVLGQVLRAQQNNGSMYVSINNGWELNELHNVQINGVQTGDLIQYESSSYGLWKNKSIVGAGITTTSSFNSYTSSTNSRLTNIESTTASLLIETQNLELFSASALTSLSNLNTATASLFTSASLALVTASVNLNTITFTKGDGTTFPITVNTGSAGGGAAFPFTGSAQITGSLGITGSFNTLPITLSVAASTASIDMRAGNTFVLNIPTGSTTHIIPTNIIAGQTINLLVKQAAGAITGSLSYSPIILFPSGLDMVATSTGSAIDLISMISFDTTNLMAANVKNLK